MIDFGIIKSFRASINPKSAGMAWYLTMLNFENFSEELNKKIKGFILANKEIMFAVSSVGKWQYHFEVICKDQIHYETFLMNIRKTFFENLKSLETLIVFKEHKYTNLPGVITKVCD